MRRKLSIAVLFVTMVLPCARAFADDSVPQLVESNGKWTFAWPELEGVISGGHEHGIELTKGADGRPVTRGMCMNLEHYFADGRGGRFVPRNLADVKSAKLSAEALQVDIAPYPDWPVRSVITYRLRPNRVIETDYEFQFSEAIPGFEAFISNYFQAPEEPQLKLAGTWTKIALTEKEHRCWLRSKDLALKLFDGRYDTSIKELGSAFAMTMDFRPYEQPVMISPIGESGWSVVHVLNRDDCASLSANRTWNAHDFSLLGRDVSKGESVHCRVLMAYLKLNNPDEALALQELLK